MTFSRQIDIIPYNPLTIQSVSINKKQYKKTLVEELEEEDEDIALNDNKEDKDDYLGSEDKIDIDLSNYITLNVQKDTYQSVYFLLDDIKYKGNIYILEEVIAYLYSKYKGNKVLINKVAKFIENFYNRCSSCTIFSSNLYLRSIKCYFKYIVCNFIKGKLYCYLPTCLEILVACYCDLKGELNSIITSYLAFFGLRDLIYIQTFKEKTKGVTSSTASIGNYNIQVVYIDNIAANLQDISCYIAAFENYTIALEEVVTKEELYNSIKYIVDKINKLYKNLMIEERIYAIVKEALQELIVTIGLLQKLTIVYTKSTSRTLDNLKVEV